MAGIFLAQATFAAARPSLAKINALLDSARDLERKDTWAGVPQLYAQVIAECGDPVSHDFQHIVAKALVQTGIAELALGHLPESQAAFQKSVTQFGSSYDQAVRPWIVKARVLGSRVDEIRKMAAGTSYVESTPPTVKLPTTTKEKEPLILVTDRSTGAQNGSGGATTGFTVKQFTGTDADIEADAERKASTPGRLVLNKGREMAVVTCDILPGSCWDWVDVVFNRAGFKEKKRAVISKTPKAGPYVEIAQVQPGDWMYYLNRSYANSEHSGIFVGWIDRANHVALVLSYPGGDRKEPGRYRPYELTGVFRITRPA